MKVFRFMALLLFAVMCSASAYAQQYTLKGVVVDKSDEPLIGATVMVKGTNKGVSTDIDGNFAINVTKGEKVTVSYIGYDAQEIEVTGQNDIKVTLLENSLLLDDVVVIGYGTMKKKDLTGSISQIDPSKLEDSHPANVQDLLRGVPGLKVGYDASAKGGGSLTLRGQNSVYNEGDHNSPLIVVDGMIYYGELSEIAPEDIKQIDVLKDASSTAIYGARAASGVIIITTKTGKSGKPQVTLSANVGFVTKSAYREIMTPEENLKYREDYFKRQTYGFNPETGVYETYQARNNDGSYKVQPGYYDHYSQAGKYGMSSNDWAIMSSNPDGASLDEIYFRRIFDMGQVNSNLLENYLAGRTQDWNGLTFRTGFRQDYSLSLAGGNDYVTYYLSLGYLNSKGAIRGDDYRAYRGSAKINAKVASFLELGANINFQDRTDGNIAVAFSENYWENDQLRNSPWASYQNADGTYVQYPMGTDRQKRGYNYDFDKQWYKLDKGYTVLNTILTAKVILPAGVTYQLNFAPRYQYFHDRYFMSADMPDANPASKGVNRGWGKNFDWTVNNTINWDYTFNDIHHVIATVAQEAEENRYWSDAVQARNIKPSDSLGFHNTENATITDSKFSTYDSKFTADAWLGRAFYSFDNRYMITATIRRDGYSAFGQNNPHATFPSVALGWVISNEKFAERSSEWLNYLKLRLSWGKNGNRALKDPYISMANLSSGAGATMSYLDGNGNPVLEYKYLMMDRLANKDLKWETTTAYNAGLDFGFLNDRISGNIDFYHKTTRDMLIYMSLPGFSGFSGVWTNIGQVDNTGIEVSLNTRNIELPNFLWTMNVGFTYNKNRIRHIKNEIEVDYDDNGNIVGSHEVNDNGNGWYINKSIGEIWDYEFGGIWQADEASEAAKYGQQPGDPKVVNHYTKDDEILADGTRKAVFNDNDKVYLGPTVAPVFWNMRHDFSFWNNLTVGFSLYSYMGHSQMRGDYLNSENDGSLFTYGFNKFKHEYWTPENPSNKYARFEAQGPSGVRPLRKINRSFVRFDNLSIGYTLPTKWTQKASLEKVRFSFNINNLGTIHSKDWIWGDPETGGLATRNYTLGVNIIFK